MPHVLREPQCKSAEENHRLYTVSETRRSGSVMGIACALREQVTGYSFIICMEGLCKDFFTDVCMGRLRYFIIFLILKENK